MRDLLYTIKNLKIKIDPELNCQLRINAMKILREERGYGIGHAKDELDEILSNFDSVTGEPINGHYELQKHSIEWGIFPLMFNMILDDVSDTVKSIKVGDLTYTEKEYEEVKLDAEFWFSNLNPSQKQNARILIH